MADLPESSAKLLRHCVVDYRVDGAVEVDAEPAEKQEPVVQVGLVQEGVHHHQSAVRHPEHSEEDHYHCQHLGHLQEGQQEESSKDQLSHFFLIILLKQPGSGKWMLYWTATVQLLVASHVKRSV